ncbi:hypothetical protein RHGRI_007316 [Rhododendron griersonianum]|uniref:Uncharacterized protein n=1 Tax=Rhododendron griersonianum TaxID=479676 RepID=A0AAV6KXP0_9ERIC|nr:hypothetical protein RHGRI_007316 [Rhododendron griersonianum]
MKPDLGFIVLKVESYAEDYKAEISKLINSRFRLEEMKKVLGNFAASVGLEFLEAYLPYSKELDSPVSMKSANPSAVATADGKSLIPSLSSSNCAQFCRPDMKLNTLSSSDMFLMSNIKELNSFT